MTYKICQVIFSTNRLEYLLPTLEAQRNLNYHGCEVHKIFIDDYPKTRDDAYTTELVKSYGYDEIILHPNNQGLSVTWTEFWELIKDRDYDYVFHQEDDVEILEPVLVTDLIELLERDQTISQVQLARQAWYPNETDPASAPDDQIYKNFRYLKKLNKDGEYSWVKINLQSSTEPVEALDKNEVILNIPQYDYYFTQDNEINEEQLEGIQWENVGNFE